VPGFLEMEEHLRRRYRNIWGTFPWPRGQKLKELFLKIILHKLDFSWHQNFAMCRGSCPSVCLTVTSISSHSFKDKELRFGTQTPHLNATKVTKRILKILSLG